MRPKTNRLLMLLVGAAISGCASQTDRSSSGGGDQVQIEHERVGHSTNAVTQEELARRAAAKAAAETAPAAAAETALAYEPQKESVQYVDRPLEETPPPKPAAAVASKDEAIAEFPITKYELPEEQAIDDEVEDLGTQEDESVSAEQDAALAEEGAVGETTEYADDSDSDDVEDIGTQEDESMSAEQDAAAEQESSVGETTGYADDADSDEVADLGTQPDESGTVTYPEEKLAAGGSVVGEPKVYQDEPAPQAAPTAPQKPKPAAPKAVSVSFETEPLFNFDKSEIRADQRAKLDEFISGLSGTQYHAISVVGHADRIGKNTYNQKLSERRAQAVKAYLVRKGVPADKIQTEGRGETDQIGRAHV